jgi:nitrite reductase/ring-hydroxylating ferredoxin subunit
MSPGIILQPQEQNRAMSKRPPFVKVASTQEIPEGSIRHIVVHDKPMALCNVEGQFYAVNAVCPHMGGPLASGGGWKDA